jgi:hypothetical protein
MSGKTPHDNLFRLAFSQVPHATAHFRATLPPAVVEKVRWETLQLQPGSFVDPELQHLQSDVLYQARLVGEGAHALPDSALARNASSPRSATTTTMRGVRTR